MHTFVNKELSKVSIGCSSSPPRRRSHSAGTCVLFLFGYVCCSIGAVYRVSLRRYLSTLGPNWQLIGPQVLSPIKVGV